MSFFRILLVFGVFLLTSCGFVFKEHITGKYYAIGVDTRFDVSLSYENSRGEYSGKAPGRLLEYGYNDSFLVARTEEYSKVNSSYYIIDMTKDSELAHDETFRIGPLSRKDFDSIWNRKLAIEMKSIK